MQSSDREEDREPMVSYGIGGAGNIRRRSEAKVPDDIVEAAGSTIRKLSVTGSSNGSLLDKIVPNKLQEKMEHTETSPPKQS